LLSISCATLKNVIGFTHKQQRVLTFWIGCFRLKNNGKLKQSDMMLRLMATSQIQNQKYGLSLLCLPLELETLMFRLVPCSVRRKKWSSFLFLRAVLEKKEDNKSEKEKLNNGIIVLSIGSALRTE